MNYKCKTPVVVFIFKRVQKTKLVIEQIAKVKPSKLFLISDAGRNEDEQILVEKCRRVAEESVNWDCQIVKNYADKNVGVFDRIGLGARWVFESEDSAIFLEDDSLAAESFFRYCDELLEKYRTDNKVMWICGTNYLGESQFKNKASYTFTRHLLPCGWASWSHKYKKYYDSNFKLLSDSETMRRVRKNYQSLKLLNYDVARWKSEILYREKHGRYNSWDYQMGFSLRAHNLLGIAPKYNQIENIGVDEHSIHGGVSFDNIMTERFCGIPTKELEFPLIHPELYLIDDFFEKKTTQIVIPPRETKVLSFFVRIIKRVFGISNEVSFRKVLNRLLRRSIR